jgi:hypothetical protein
MAPSLCLQKCEQSLGVCGAQNIDVEIRAMFKIARQAQLQFLGK